MIPEMEHTLAHKKREIFPSWSEWHFLPLTPGAAPPLSSEF